MKKLPKRTKNYEKTTQNYETKLPKTMKKNYKKL